MNYELFMYLCTNGTEKHTRKRREDCAALYSGWCHFVVDVPWRGLLDNQSCTDGGDGLDMDAALVSFRHLGTDVPWLALEADSGADSYEE